MDRAESSATSRHRPNLNSPGFLAMGDGEPDPAGRSPCTARRAANCDGARLAVGLSGWPWFVYNDGMIHIRLDEPTRDELQRMRRQDLPTRARDRLEMVCLSDAGWEPARIADHL